MARIILASASPRRKDILEQVGISCEVIPSSIDEDLITADSPSALVEALSKAKAEDVAAHFENDFVVIGADTVVVKDSKVLGSPLMRQKLIRCSRCFRATVMRFLPG